MCYGIDTMNSQLGKPYRWCYGRDNRVERERERRERLTLILTHAYIVRVLCVWMRCVYVALISIYIFPICSEGSFWLHIFITYFGFSVWVFIHLERGNVTKNNHTHTYTHIHTHTHTHTHTQIHAYEQHLHRKNV